LLLNLGNRKLKPRNFGRLKHVTEWIQSHILKCNHRGYSFKVLGLYST